MPSFANTLLARLDPAEWIPKQFAIVNIDARGVGDSEGDIRCWSSGEGRDGYDAIEEISQLPWCTGKVSMAGNSWLAICQWYVAAEQPPHLTCIAPMEGLSDPYREHVCRGGIPNTRFMAPLCASFIGKICITLFHDSKANTQREERQGGHAGDGREVPKQQFILGR